MKNSAVSVRNTYSQANVLIERYKRIRRQSETLCRPLQDEDYSLQAMADVSPPKWHLAHTTWFFETLLLKEFSAHYKVYNLQYEFLFNSYYLSLGAPYPRDRRGLLSRPTIDEVIKYRRIIDERVIELLANSPADIPHPRLIERLELGLNHEQQHQELLLTDIKYNFFVNPLLPAYLDNDLTLATNTRRDAKPVNWIEFARGIAHIGAITTQGFCFDNETPRHLTFLQRYALADRPVNNGEYLKFIQEGGYQRAEFWLADGWQKKTAEGWNAPLYWQQGEHKWEVYTLRGVRPLRAGDPVCHVSYYEADAFARWAGARLPTEMEWERAAAAEKVEGHFVCDGVLQPRQSCQDRVGLQQMFGDVWEWTASAYSAYPGFASPQGAVGEYNGKFMCSQMVLRGGSCLSEREHIRLSYRNFFYPWTRWQVSGIRLAMSFQ